MMKENSITTTEKLKIYHDTLINIRQMAWEHPMFDQAAFDKRDINGLVTVGGDICDWTMIAILADDALER